MNKDLEVWNGLAHSGNARHLEWLKCYRLETGTVGELSDGVGDG